MKPSLSVRAGRLLRESFPARVTGGYAGERAAFVRAALGEHGSGARRQLFPTWAAVAVVASAPVIALAWYGFRAGSTEDDVAFQVGADQEPGETGQYYAAESTAGLPLHFEDGSAIELSSGARARVSTARAQHRVVLLETGTAEFRIAHRPGTRWQVTAGPYTVHVTGTQFRLSWDGSSQQLSLQMLSGSVLVTGPNIQGERRVQGQESFTTAPRVAGHSALAADEPHARTAGQGAGAGATPSARPPVTQRREDASSERAEDWQTLVARGAYSAVLDAAEQRGFDATLASASSGDLRALADAARFSGKSSLARRTLLALRSRHPGSEHAIAATFLLGRLADDASDPRSALTFYDQYLAEGGPLAPEALGRRMLALERLGNRAECRAVAKDYLRRFPSGPYAKRAKTLAR